MLTSSTWDNNDSEIESIDVVPLYDIQQRGSKVTRQRRDGEGRQGGVRKPLLLAGFAVLVIYLLIVSITLEKANKLIYGKPAPEKTKSREPSAVVVQEMELK